MSDRILFVHCVNCHRVFEQIGNNDFCSTKCERDFYTKIRQCSLKDKPLVECTAAEKVLRSIRGW